MPPDSLPEALRRLDPGSRALLDLSLRQAVPDDEIAQLLRVGVPELRRRRAQAIETVAIELDIERPSDRGELRKQIAELSPDAWDTSQPARGQVAEDPEGESAVEGEDSLDAEPVQDPVEDERPVEDEETPEDEEPIEDEVATGEADADERLTDARDPDEDRPSLHPAAVEHDEDATDHAERVRPVRRRGRDAAAPAAERVQPIEAGERRRRIPFGAVAALVVLVAIGIGVLLASTRGADDPDQGTTQAETTGEDPAQSDGSPDGGGESGNGQGTSDGQAEGEEQAEGEQQGQGEGEPGGQGGGQGGDGPAEQPGGGGTPLEPLSGRDAPGKGTARLVTQDGQARLELSLRGLPKPDGAYEVWLYESLTNAVSVGRFKQGRVELVAPLREDPGGFTSVDISLEPADGNPNHSGRSLLRVPIEKLQAG